MPAAALCGQRRHRARPADDVGHGALRRAADRRHGLHSGRIAEMATGEGKTLVATLPVYLNALTGRGAHLVTVNDYLARRDAEWMGALYQVSRADRRLHSARPAAGCAPRAIRCDITYGTNAEFGFDYLRDNGMATRKEEQVQRGHYFAIVDEVDSILIDEARTPLIISGPAVVNVDNIIYDQLKPLVESARARAGTALQPVLAEAEALIKKLRPKMVATEQVRELEREIGLLLYRVKLGQPRTEELAAHDGRPGKSRADEQGRAAAAPGSIARRNSSR